MKDELLCQKEKNILQMNLNNELNILENPIEKPIELFTNETKNVLQKNLLKDTTKNRKQYKAEWYLKNKEKITLQHKEYSKNNIKKICERAKINRQKYKINGNPHALTSLKNRYYMWKYNAKVRNLIFDLNINDIEQLPLVCFYTGKNLTLEKNYPHTVSLDRIDSKLGYVKHNTVLCCSYINTMKSDLSYNDFIMFCEQIYKHTSNLS